MGMKADGNLYIAAQFLDTFDEIGKQVEKGAAKISNNTKIDLSLDEKNILKEINSMLGSTKFKDLDLSDIVSSVFASISKEGMSSKDRTKILDDFQYNLRMFHTAPFKTIKQLKGVKSENLTGILQEIQTDSLSDNPKRQWTSSNLKNNIKEIIDEHLKTVIDNTIDSIQETLVQEFGKDTAKYGVSGKEANNRLNNIYDSLVQEADKQSKQYKSNVDLSEVVSDNDLKNIQGFYSRIESLGEIASDKAKKLVDMLTSMSNDGAIEEELDDIIYQISEDVNSFTEKEKQLIQETKQQQKEIDELNAQNKSSSRQKIKPNFNVENQEQDTTSTIFQSAEKENKIQETKTQQQENKKIIEQANEITATESKTVDIKKQQTQEIEKQNDLLKKQKQIKDETTPIKSEIDISSQDQVQQEIQETASTAQSAVKSNEQLAESVQEVTQAVQQKGQAMSNSSIDDYLVKWIEMVRGTKAYSGMEERAVYLKGGIPTSDIGQGKLSYKNGFVQGQTSIKQYKGGEADTLLHSHQYSKDVDNLRFSFSDIKQGMSDLAEGVQNGIHKLILSCGDEILSLDFGNVSKETASEVQENIRQIYTAAWTIFGGQVFSDGTASERGMTDELRNKASAFINTMLRKMLEEMGGSLTSAKLVDGKMIDTTAFRLNQAITPQQQSLYEQIKKIYGLSENEYEGYRGDILKKLQKDNGIKTNLTGLVGLSPEQLEEVDKLLLQIFNHKQQLENAKAGSRMAATIQEKIDEAEKRIAEITKVSNKDIQQQADKKLDEEKVDVVSEKETDNSQQELKIVEKIEEVENNIANEKEKQAEQTQKQNDVLQQQKENESNIKEQNEDVVNKKEEAIEKTREELQTEQQLTNELKEQKSIEQTSGETSKEDNKESELQTIKEIKEETQQVVEQQQKVAEAKQETLQAAQEELKTEQQLSIESQKQEKTEEQKPAIKLKDKGKKLADVQKHGKSQAEIDAQLKANEEKKKKKTSISKVDLEEKEKANNAAAADAKADEEKQRQQAIEDQNFLAALRAKYAEAEAQQAEKEAQKIEVTSEQMQKLKQGIQEATEALKEYKEIDEQIIKLQSDKDAHIISPSTQNEMMQAGVLSSSIDMAEYIRSAYRTYKKTGNEADEKVLKEALRQYMLPTGKKNGEYTYRDDKYLYSKNGKELKSYTKDKDFKGYIKQAQDEEAAYEKAQRKLPTLLDQKKSGQQSFVETSAKIQQLLQEAGLDADKVNEILAAINGNLTNEEAIWEVINSYIKEASKELDKQKELTEKTESSVLEKPKEDITSKNASENKIEQTDITRQEEKNQQAIEKTIELTEKFQEQTQELITPKTTESSVMNQIGEEAKETKQKVDEVVESIKNVGDEAKKQSISKKTDNIESEFSEKTFARSYIQGSTPPFKEAKHWIDSGVKTDNIEKLKTYYQQYENIVNKIKSTKETPETKPRFKAWAEEYDKVRESVISVIDAIKKVDSEENKILSKQKAQKDIIKGTINDRAVLARNAQKNLDSNYYDKQIVRADTILSQYTPTESPEAAKVIEQANNALDKYKNKVDELKRFSTGDLELDRPFEELIEEVNKAGDEVKELTKNIQDNFSKVANPNSITDLQSQIKSILSTYNRISPEGKQKLEDIFGSLKIGETTTKQLANFRTQLRATIAEERELGNLSSTIFDRMVGKMQEGIAFLATKVSFYEIFNQFRNGFGIIHEFDDALTEMMKVSDETRISLERYQKTTFETADAIGTSALQIQNSTADFMRLGETLDQAAESARTANVLMNVSEFQSIDEATKSLIAMSAAYDDLSKMNIIDKLNEVGLKIA